jgi:hypothetical protein
MPGNFYHNYISCEQNYKTAGGGYRHYRRTGKRDICWGGDVEEGRGFENAGLISVTQVYFRNFPFWILLTGPSRYNEMLFARS